MKKYLAIVLAAFLILCCASCGGTGAKSNPVPGYIETPDIVYSTTAEENGLADTLMYLDGKAGDHFTVSEYASFYADDGRGKVALIGIPYLSSDLPEAGTKNIRMYFSYAGWSDVYSCPAGYFVAYTDYQNSGQTVMDAAAAKELVSSGSDMETNATASTSSESPNPSPFSSLSPSPSLAPSPTLTPTPMPEPTPSISSKPEYYFKDNVLTTKEVRIEITDYSVVQPGEDGNKYSDVPVIVFFYDTTNVSGSDISASTAWTLYFSAYQDTDPNYVNKLSVASLSDSQYRETRTATIKEGGTVSNAIAYKLDSNTVPVVLKAKDGITGVLGEQEFDIASLVSAPTPKADADNSSVDQTESEPFGMSNLEIIANALNDTLKSYYGDNTNVKYGTDKEGAPVIDAKFWEKGSTLNAVFAKTDFQDYKSKWDDMVSTLDSFSDVAMEMMDENGLSDGHLYLQYLNDSNTESTLLTIKDGEVIYDFVNDIGTSQ